MKIIKIFQSHFNFFHLIGQSLIIRNENHFEITKFKKLIEFIPGLIVLMVHFTSIFLEILNHYVRGNESYESTSATMFIIRMFTLAITQLIVFIHIFRSPKENYRILESFDRLAWYLQKRMNMIVSYDKFKKRYSKRLLIIVCGYSVSLILKMVASLILRIKFFDSHTVLMIIRALLPPAVKIHALFYIDFLNWLLQIGNDYIEMNLNDIPFERYMEMRDTRKNTDILRHCKYIHFKLWKSRQIIEHHFGWLLISILIYAFVEILFSLFYIFLLAYWSEKWSLLGEYVKKINILL